MILARVDDETMRNFCSSYSLNSLIKQPTCFKNSENPSCIDLNLTNKPLCFQGTCVCACAFALTDYTKNPDLFFNIYQDEINHHAARKKYIRGE